MSSEFWSRAKSSHFVQALVVYLAAAWVALQVLALFTSAFDWPQWVVRGAIVLLAAGLVVTLLVVWARARHQITAGEAADTSAPGRRRRALTGATVVALLILGGALWLVVRDRGRSLVPDTASAENAGPGIAILPFEVNDPQLDRWREGMVDLLSTNLDGAGGLRAIDSRTVLALWHREVPDGEPADLATALEIGRRSGGRYGLIGSVVTTGSDLRIAADVYDLETGRSLGAERVEGAPDSIFPLVDRLSIELLDRLLAEDATLPDLDLAGITTRSVPALKSFLDGEALFRHAQFDPAIEAYEAAVEEDSTFALAWFRLGEASGWMETLGSERTDEALAAASRLADRLPPRDRDLLRVSLAYHQNHPDATRLARAAVARYPDDPVAWYLLGEVHFHLPNQALPSRAEQEEPFVRATRLDPTFTPAYIHLLDLAFTWSDSARARTLLGRFDELAGASLHDQLYGAAYRLAFGDAVARAAAMEGLDSVATRGLRHIIPRLSHPRLLGLQARLIRGYAARPETPSSAVEPMRIGNMIMRGRLDEAQRTVDAPGVPPAHRALFYTFAYMLGAPLDSVAYARELALSEADSISDESLLPRVIYAVDHGQEARLDPLEARVRAEMEAARAGGDTVRVREMESGFRVVEGRVAMKEGRPEEALENLERAFREDGTQFALPWIMQLHAQAGRPREAIRYGELVGPNPWIGLPLGRLYEAVGDHGKALDAYGWVVEGWREADPILQSQVVEARTSIARVAGVDRD